MRLRQAESLRYWLAGQRVASIAAGEFAEVLASQDARA